MRYRHTDILAEEAASTAGTKTLDVDLQDVISRIIIRFRATNGASRATLLVHPAGLVSKVELVDGSDVLYSLSGHEAQALNYYESLATPDSEIADGGGDDQWATLMLNFGRYLNDPLLAFDPKRFKNPQLKITHNYAACDASAASGHLLVKADVFDEFQPSPVGFLTAKQIQTYTMVSASYQSIDIPTDRPYRRLLVRPYLTNSSPPSQLSQFKLSEENDKRIPIDTDIEQYVRWLINNQPFMMEHFALRIQTAVTSAYVIPTYWPNVVGEWSQHSYAIGRITYYQAERQGLFSATNGSYPWMGIAYGYLPHHTIDFPFGDPADMNDWYDVTMLGSLKARLLSATSATAACTLFGQQLRRY